LSRTVFLCYIYGPRNAGDMSLNLGAIDVLNRVGTFRIVGLSRFNASNDQYARTRTYLTEKYPNLQIVPYPVAYDRWRQGKPRRLISLLRGGAMLARTLCGGRNHAGGLADYLAEADLLLFNGGNLLFARNVRDLPRLLGILYPLSLARRMGKRYAFLPQSIPGLDSAIGRRIVASALRGASFVHFREGLSGRKVSMGDSVKTRDVLDLAFFIEGIDDDGTAALIREHGLVEKQFVPIIVRSTGLGDYGSLTSDDMRHVVANVCDVCARIADEGHRPCFVVQTTTDMDVSRRCQQAAAAVGINAPLLEEYDPLVLRGLYAQAKAVVSCRLHAAILALSVGTRTFGLFRSIWGPKMLGTFAALGIPEMCMCIDDAADCIGFIDIGTADSGDERFKRDVLATVDQSRGRYVALLQEQMGL